jgi:hypothetical protein
MEQDNTEQTIQAPVSATQAFDKIVLDNKQALIILINAAHLGQKAGIFSLVEAEVISKAIRHFSTPPPTSESLQ